MGLSHYPSAAEGVLPVLVMNTVISVAILKSMVRWVLQVIGCVENPTQFRHEEEEEQGSNEGRYLENLRESRRISVTLFKSIPHNGFRRIATTSSGGGGGGGRLCPVECCVCLHGFEADQQVSELSCKHFFHKGCLEKWFDHKRSTLSRADLFPLANTLPTSVTLPSD